jgi:hypothetical protein
LTTKQQAPSQGYAPQLSRVKFEAHDHSAVHELYVFELKTKTTSRLSSPKFNHGLLGALYFVSQCVPVLLQCVHACWSLIVQPLFHLV